MPRIVLHCANNSGDSTARVEALDSEQHRRRKWQKQ